MSETLVRCDLLCLDLPKAERLRGELREVDVERSVLGARALADSTRMSIAAVLAATDEVCVCDISWVVARSDKLVSHHLRTLREAGLAENRRAGKVVYYRLTDTGRALLGALLALPPEVVER
jgi:DNA-binding transcriptional ArsR family regulator